MTQESREDDTQIIQSRYARPSVDKLNALLTSIASKLDGLSGVKEVCSLFRSTTWGEQVLEYLGTRFHAISIHNGMYWA